MRLPRFGAGHVALVQQLIGALRRLEHGVRFMISRAACHTSRSSIMRRRFALDVGFQLALIQCGQPSDDNHSNHGEDNKDVYHEFLLHSGHRGAGGRTAASCSASASDPRS
jgi:hypothetical protein